MILYYVKKGNSFSCVLFSLLWTDLSLLVKLTSEIYLRYLSKISSEYPLFFKHILKIHTKLYSSILQAHFENLY